MKNPFLQRKQKLEENKRKMKEAISKSPISDQSQMMINAISRNGVLRTRQALLDGLPKDWAEDYPDTMPTIGLTIDKILAPYRSEPKFNDLIARLQITWKDLEKLAGKFIEGK